MYRVDFSIRTCLMNVTKTLLKKVIKDVIPDPKAPGTFRVIADVGDTGYYDERAIEAIRCGDRKLGIQLLLLSEVYDSGRDSGAVERGSTGCQGDEGHDQSQEKVDSVRRPDDGHPKFPRRND